MLDKLSIRSSVEAYCAKIGGDHLLVQGAGGNASWKDGSLMWVKASGTWLKDATEKNIFVSIDLRELKKNLSEENFSYTPIAIDDSGLRPSIETLLHGLMPHPIVVHIHAVEVLAWLVRRDPIPELHRLLTNYSCAWEVVDYKKPGADLAQVISSALHRNPGIDVVLMLNHGVVIGGDSVEDVDSKLRELVDTLKIEPISLKPNNSSECCLNSLGSLGYKRIQDVFINQLALDAELFARLENDWVLYPDHVVFLGAKAMAVELSQIDSLLANELKPIPELIFVHGNGVYSRQELSAAKHAQLLCYYHVISRQSPSVLLNPLSIESIASLLNWDAEVYRQALAK